MHIPQIFLIAPFLVLINSPNLPIESKQIYVFFSSSKYHITQKQKAVESHVNQLKKCKQKYFSTEI